MLSITAKYLQIMKQTIKFDKSRDIKEVDKFGFVDLYLCLRTGSVPSDVSASVANYNGIEDPQSIIGSPSDIFEAMRMHDEIKNNASSASADDNG